MTELLRCRELGLQILSARSPLYPEMLRTISDPPAPLYVRGLLPVQRHALAIVGSRRPTPYGRRMARSLAAECARAHIPVVSGLARGIDAEAHEAALANGGITWAVLGSGLDRIYPREHEALAEQIMRSGGALISEIPLSGAPASANFPRRNRILSGLCWGSIVVEGDLHSGSLITARCAAEQGREVFAVPGPADSPLSEGPHMLIRQGAGLVRCLEDVLEALPVLADQHAENTPMEAGSALGRAALGQATCREFTATTLEEQKILELIGTHALSLEDLTGGTGWELSKLIPILSQLEIKALLTSLPGQRYARP